MHTPASCTSNTVGALIETDGKKVIKSEAACMTFPTIITDPEESVYQVSFHMHVMTNKDV